MNAHAAVHIDVDGHIDEPIYVDFEHYDGIGIRITSGDNTHVWLCGSVDQLHGFASEVHRHTNRAARELLRSPSPDVAADPVVLPASPVEDAA